MRKAFVLVVVMATVHAAPLFLQKAVAQEPAPGYYGTAATNYHFISAEEFHNTFDPVYSHTSDGFWTSNVSLVVDSNMAPLRLPSGALVDGYTVVYDDSHPVLNLTLELNRYWVSSLGTAGTVQIGPTFTSLGVPGIESDWVNLDPDLTISYFNSGSLTYQSYAFTLALPENELVRFRGVIVHWKRQISPAPVVATFPDVAPSYWAFQYIEALAASEITTGFPDGTFRPTEPVNRAQMATFLSRALGLHWAP